jgi:hypothetical protein
MKEDGTPQKNYQLSFNFEDDSTKIVYHRETRIISFRNDADYHRRIQITREILQKTKSW